MGIVSDNDNACRELIDKIISGKVRTHEQLEIEKTAAAGKYFLNRIIKNSDIMVYAEKNYPLVTLLRKFLRTKPTRTLSGVASIAVMWLGDNGFSCPHACIYCPRSSDTPKSYIGVEPTTLRAMRNKYDPYLQVENRLCQLKAIGHATDKCELIVMGGTLLSWKRENITSFVKGCFDSLNGQQSMNLKEAQRINETAANRCVGLTIETRADYCTQEQIDYMLFLGTTRAEIGVQTTDGDLLNIINRGHGVNANTEAFQRLRDAGLKITAHWMPGLTGLEKLDLDKEISDFKELFSNPAYRPDELKIYPTLVIPGTKLYELWNNGKYDAMDFERSLELLIELKKIVPEYVRIKRVSRDISEHKISAGSGKTNLRQLASERMNALGIKCRCIRCREISNRKGRLEDVKLRKLEYKASDGREIFLSLEDNDALIGFLRLRIDNSNTAKIRELHVYGELAPIGARGKSNGKHSNKMAIDFFAGARKGIWQHHGFGKKLMQEAEWIAKELGKNKMQVTSGVGAREYYRRIGYALEKPYMARRI